MTHYLVVCKLVQDDNKVVKWCYCLLSFYKVQILRARAQEPDGLGGFW